MGYEDCSNSMSRLPRCPQLRRARRHVDEDRHQPKDHEAYNADRLLQLCASGAGIGLASIGLAVVREEASTKHQTSRDPSPFNPEMTAVATYPQSNLSSSFAFVTPQSARSVSEGPNGKARSGNARVGQKRTLTPRASFSMGMERPLERGDESESRVGTPNTAGTYSGQPHSWLRRFSSSVSTSRDSSQTPTSRPASAAVSQSNGSVAFSHAGSTTPMFSDNTRPALLPNKLVKRTSSIRSSSASPFQTSGSRLPLPVFRRPATSHQRSATLQERHSGTDQSDHMSLDEKSSAARDPQSRLYFTPKVASGELAFARRRSSTGIPNPIRRVYPDRKYTPVLVSGRDVIRPAETEVDDGVNSDEDSLGVMNLTMAPSVASSPLPIHAPHFEEGQPPKRSFSIGDLLSTGPQPLWRRPSQHRGEISGSKLVRKGRQRITSAPQAPMGSSFSRNTGTETERPAKRRDITDPQAAQRTIYSSPSSIQHADLESYHQIQLNLGENTSQSTPFNTSNSPFTETPGHAQTPSSLEQRRLASATNSSAVARPIRVSAAQSEITSTVDSDSEYRSVGDASTDYQSDTFYDSYPTRTTRSSSGRRGPHIETIFDDSPPNFSSGRSTRLRDLLNEGTPAGGEYGARYRHSTIEEEESMVSTPVRSLHNTSVTSTPSARRGAQQSFTSSPPTIPIIPDPDEIDWDAPDDEPARDGPGNQQPSSTFPSNAVERSLPFRFGPALRQPQSTSAATTPHRPDGNNVDRANLFDWSEVQPSPSYNQSPPRPRTVHGKKDPESRGSRPAGRRAPSGMHARSHSVPVVPDVDGKRSNVVANKFGTWGVGSKAVTEDWNDDFEFDESLAPIPESLKQEEKRIDSGHEMFVPRSIREQQENVVAHIGLLREWGLLIEELKELRIRAVALDMINGPYAHAWEEVDAMIELADQETEEHTLEPRRSPPSSPGFDYDAFEEPTPNTRTAARPRGQSVRLPESILQEGDHSTGFTAASPSPSTPQHTFVARPRKDSEAVARSVIEALQSKRSVSDPTALKPVPPSKKVPFDTATLRHIVPYVSGLKRKIKDALRETEGLYSSPRRRVSLDLNGRGNDDDDEPAFRSIFNEPGYGHSPSKQSSRRRQAATDHDGFENDTSPDHNGDLSKRMQNMTQRKK